MLEQELDNLDEPEHTKISQDIPDAIVETISDSVPDMALTGDWTLLNVDFGIPLFDAQLNDAVCRRITGQQLWRKEALDALKQHQHSLTQRLTDFIRSHIDLAESESNDVALPTHNLLFSDGTLHTWNGQWSFFTTHSIPFHLTSPEKSHGDGNDCLRIISRVEVHQLFDSVIPNWRGKW